jgi:hypothetical protein
MGDAVPYELKRFNAYPPALNFIEIRGAVPEMNMRGNKDGCFPVKNRLQFTIRNASIFINKLQ